MKDVAEQMHRTPAPDGDFLVAQLRTFQTAMGKGAPGQWEWHDLVALEVRQRFSEKEAERQA